MIDSLIKTHHLTSKAKPWIDAAVGEHASGEEVTWELSVMAMPGPQGQPQPTLVLMAWIPSPIVGQPIGGMCPIDNPLGFDREAAQDIVPAFLRHLREQRSQMLASQGQSHQDVTEHLGRGH